jgi:SAM-dependent methyltransferase
MGKGEPGYFAQPLVMDAMSAEHLYLWRSLFQACGPLMKDEMRILDFGCGNGSMLAYLMRGDGRVWKGCRFSLGMGIDRPELDAVLAEAAGRMGGMLPVAFSSAPASAFPGQFDLVVSHEVIYLLPALVRTFAELHTSLRNGGSVALATGCHMENELYPRWLEAFGRLGVHAHRYRTDDYTRALRDAGFDEIETGRVRLAPGDYDEWVDARGSRDPNPDWFPTAEEERRYYTESGKLLILARRPDRAAGPEAGGRGSAP